MSTSATRIAFAVSLLFSTSCGSERSERSKRHGTTGDREVAWARQTEGGGEGAGLSLALLPDDSVYVAGEFYGYAELGGVALQSEGGRNTLLAAFAPDGALVRAGLIGGTGDSAGFSIAAGPDGSTYLTGWFWDTMVLGPTTLTSLGAFDMFVARVAPDGSIPWAAQAGGAGLDVGRGVAILADGSFCVVGEFSETATFGTTTLTTAGESDIFLARYGADGSLLWVTAAGGPGSDGASAVAVLPDGSTYVAGVFRETASFGAASTLTVGADLGTDAFLARYEADGSLCWVEQAGASTYASGNSIAVGADGAAYVTGSFSGNAFGPTALTTSAEEGFFLASYGSDGSLAWARQADGSGASAGASVAARSDGALLVTGYFAGSATFDSSVLVSAGDEDVFLVSYDRDGIVQNAQRAGGAGSDSSQAVAVLSDGAAYVSGSFSDTATFGKEVLESDGYGHFFLVKFTP